MRESNAIKLYMGNTTAHCLQIMVSIIYIRQDRIILYTNKYIKQLIKRIFLEHFCVHFLNRNHIREIIFYPHNK